MEELKNRIQILEEEIKMLKASTTIPYEVDTAFRERFKIGDLAKLSASTKTVASETQAVNEAGAASYNVPKINDGFVETTVGGTIIYLPYYT